MIRYICCGFLTLVPVITGCGSAPIHAVEISSEKNVWVEDPGNSGLNYCMSNAEGSKADPVCYPARKAQSNERATPSSASK